MEYETKKTIKISKENYLWLLRLAAEIQKRSDKRISFNKVIEHLRNKKHFERIKGLKLV